MTSNNPEQSNCCKAPIKATHGCDDDLLHGGKKCTCEIVTSWYECEKCKQPCDVYVPYESVRRPPEQNEPCERCKGNGRIEMLEHCPKCKGSGFEPEPPEPWEELLEQWILTQHGTAGWEEKLKAFIRKVAQQAYERGFNDCSKTHYEP